MSARDLAWRAGAPVRIVLLASIRAYQLTLAGWLGGQCRFAPTCSHYAQVAIRRHGALKGSALAVWRVARCNPYGKGGIDPVPGNPRRNRGRGGRYEAIIQPLEQSVGATAGEASH
jgi:putative membrane protein insertion efficiency factor